MKRPERVAAVGKTQACLSGEAAAGHRNRTDHRSPVVSCGICPLRAIDDRPYGIVRFFDTFCIFSADTLAIWGYFSGKVLRKNPIFAILKTRKALIHKGFRVWLVRFVRFQHLCNTFFEKV